MAEKKTFYIQKLVRDKILSKFENEDCTYEHKVLDQKDYLHELKRKLVEEANEVFKSDSKQNLIEEISDVFEVLSALMQESGIYQNEVEKYRVKKNNEWGRFLDKIYVETVTASTDTEEFKYLSKNSDRYKEKV